MREVLKGLGFSVVEIGDYPAHNNRGQRCACHVDFEEEVVWVCDRASREMRARGLALAIDQIRACGIHAETR